MCSFFWGVTPRAFGGKAEILGRVFVLVWKDQPRPTRNALDAAGRRLTPLDATSTARAEAEPAESRRFTVEADCEPLRFTAPSRRQAKLWVTALEVAAGYVEANVEAAEGNRGPKRKAHLGLKLGGNPWEETDLKLLMGGKDGWMDGKEGRKEGRKEGMKE